MILMGQKIADLETNLQNSQMLVVEVKQDLISPLILLFYFLVLEVAAKHSYVSKATLYVGTGAVA